LHGVSIVTDIISSNLNDSKIGMSIMRKSLIYICLFVIFVSSAQAKLYRCKDEYNRTSFQDKPCVVAKSLKKEVKQEAVKEMGDKVMDTSPKTQTVES